MSTLVVPALDEKPWPTLGPQVVEFIEQMLIHGPGDLRGEPARVDDEKRALIYRAYEVHPKGTPNAGRRRFRRVAWSLRKGSAKTELAAWLAACELHPDAPVRCDGFDSRGRPVGIGVRDPYIPLVAYTEEQSEDLAYGALYTIISEGPLVNDFDIGLSRIMRIRGDGKAVALANAPDSRDGARTTFQVLDETHRFVLPRLREAHRVMLANLPKRRLADPWSLETTTAYAPGERSVAESTMDYARHVALGDVADARLFYFHRQASEDHDLSTDAGLRAAVIEASGPVAEWSDIEGIIEQFADPTADLSYLRRVWLNQIMHESERAFDAEAWRKLRAPSIIAHNSVITIGFHGARTRDSTALVATDVISGFQWLLGLWERPDSADEWEVPADEVDAVVADAFRRFKVWRLYAHPPYWETTIRNWAGTYGKDRVVEFWVNSGARIGPAVRSYAGAIARGEVSHSGDAHLGAHIGAAFRRPLTQADDDGSPLWSLRKERAESPHKINAAFAAVLSWEARTQALKAGKGQPAPHRVGAFLA